MENTLSLKDKFSIMVVAPGSVYSTFDMYMYYLDAFNNEENIDGCWGFGYHNVIEYHTMARLGFYDKHSIMLGSEVDDIARASRELVTEVIFRRPDVLFFIDGSKMPHAIFYELKRVQRELNRKIIMACYITESPYINEVTDSFANYMDVIFTNEKNDVARRDPKGERFIFYLPHSYSPSVHYPAPVAKKYQRDVFFCGTMYPERAKLLSGVNWSGIDALLQGSWQLAEPEDYDKTKAFGITVDSPMPNAEVAEYYRGSKISINMGRVYGWTPQLDELSIDPNAAYSMGPRIVESAACGAFILSEPRPEIVDTFGDSIPTFTDSAQLQSMIHYFLENETERNEKAAQSLKIATGMTYANRAAFVSDILKQAIQATRR